MLVHVFAADSGSLSIQAAQKIDNYQEALPPIGDDGGTGIMLLIGPNLADVYDIAPRLFSNSVGMVAIHITYHQKLYSVYSSYN